MDEKNQKSEFIREKIKDKPVNKKKAIGKLGFCALCGLVFALVAAVAFAVMEPVFQQLFHPENQGSELVTETTEGEELEADSTQEDTQEPETTTPVEPLDVELSIEDYQALQNDLYAIGNQANKSIVTVNTVTSSTDWFNNSYENQGQGSGVIISDTTAELLILTERKVIEDASSISVTFIDNSVVEATLKKYDGNTGIAVLSVDKTLLDTTTENRIQAAVFGDSAFMRNGSIVIALGSPLGTNYSILTGNITSTENEISTLDHNYSIFTTDIVASRSGSGILVNVSGEIIGIVMQDYSSSSDENTLTAVSSSELQDVITKLSAGQDISYMGLVTTTVTDRIAETYDIPKGVYVKEVTMDSPAMNGGLQAGDVITKLNGINVTTSAGYSKTVLGIAPGTSISVEAQRQGTEGYSKITCQVEVGVLQ